MEGISHHRDDQKIIDAFQNAFISLDQNPDDPHNPEFFQLYAQAGLQELVENPQVQRNLVDLKDHRPKDAESYLLKLIRINIQKNLVLKRFADPTSDLKIASYKTVDQWRELFRESVANEEEGGDYDPDLLLFSIQTNVDRRYVNVKIASFIANLVSPGRLPEDPKCLDFGASRNHGLNRLAQPELAELYPFGDIIVVNSPYEWRQVVNNKPDEEKTAFFNQAYVRPYFKIGESRGVDALPLRDGRSRIWVYSNCYPTELDDEGRLRRFARLDQPVDTVKFTQADCTDDKELTQKIPEDEIADIGIISTMLYQMKPKQQFMTIRNLAKRVNKDGFIIVLDSADAIHRPPGLKIAKPFYDNVNRPFGYKAMVLDMRRFEEGFQEYFRYENGRCNRMIPNLGNAAVRKAFQDVL